MRKKVSSDVLSLAFASGITGVVLMAAPKAAVVMIVGAGLFGLFRLVRGHGRLEIGKPPLLFLSSLGAALMVWALVTAFWAPDASRAVLQTAKVSLLSIAGLLALAGAVDSSPMAKEKAGLVIVWAVCTAGVTLIVGQVYAHMTGGSLWGQYSNDPFTTMNNGAVIMAVFLWPAVAVLWDRTKRSWAVSLVIMVILVLAPLRSSAALLSLALGTAVFVAVVIRAKITTRILASAAAAGILLMPVLVTPLPIPKDVRTRLEAGHSSISHRFLIWNYVTQKIKERPLGGWGMDASRSIGGDKKVMGNLGLVPLHPHNGALQVWLELGFPGALLFASLAAFVFLSAGLRRPLVAATACASGIGYLVISSLSYGVWQSWWIAIAWFLVVFTSILDKPEKV